MFLHEYSLRKLLYNIHSQFDIKSHQRSLGIKKKKKEKKINNNN